MSLIGLDGVRRIPDPASAMKSSRLLRTITFAVGAAPFFVTALAQPVPPKITPTTSLQHQAATIGKRVSFGVTASGTEPLAYQWRLDGHELARQTNRTLTFSAIQPADEGDYTVVVRNAGGAVTSDPARLWVVPATAFLQDNFTNTLGRLPYFYLLPTNYDATRSYPLYIRFHGTPGDERNVAPSFNTIPIFKTLASYRQQELDPVILLYPSRRAGDETWTDQYLESVSALLDQFIPQFNADTNRIYVAGGSEGVHAAWDLVAMRPSRFAGALLSSGWQGGCPAALIKEVPVWAWCPQDDDAGQIGNMRKLVNTLRATGGSVRYTEYRTGAYTDATGMSYGTHGNGEAIGSLTPAIVDWFLAQRRGVPSTAEPLLTIRNPTTEGLWLSGATNLNLTGSAAALGQNVTRVAWTNSANKLSGAASGSNVWTVAELPLVANRTNVIVVTGTTTSWAPACGGNTTFNQTLMVVCSPLLATLALEANGAVLNWTGGGPPYRIQHATDLVIGDWAEMPYDTAAPVALLLTNATGFYRVVGQ